jgi:hypothetical protein
VYSIFQIFHFLISLSLILCVVGLAILSFCKESIQAVSAAQEIISVFNSNESAVV